MGQIPSHIKKPTDEERMELFKIFEVSQAGANAHFTEEQIAILFSDEYVPPTHDLQITIMSTVVFFLIISSTSLRFYSKYRFGAKSGAQLDDWMLLVASLCCLAYGTIQWTGYLDVGYGRHMYDLSVDRINTCLKILGINLVSFTIANTAVKISVLLLYRRIFESMQTRMRTVVNVMIILVSIFAPISVVAQISTCKPIGAFWDLRQRIYDPEVKCDMSMIRNYAISGIFAAFDFIIWAIPLRHIWGIHQFSTKKKFAITGIFTLGLVACIASILKAVYYKKLIEGDFTWYCFEVTVYENVEFTCAIVAACVPSLLPMAKSVYKTTTTSLRDHTALTKSHITSHAVGSSRLSATLTGIKVSHSVTVESQEDTELMIRKKQAPSPA